MKWTDMDYGTRVWRHVYDYFEGDTYKMTVYGTSAVAWTAFWVPSLFFMFVDVTGWPACMKKYKIQPGTNSPVSKMKLAKVTLAVLLNQIVLNSLVTLVIYKFMTWRGCGFTPDEFPPLWGIYVEFKLLALWEEFGFYYTHRLFHHPLLYKHIHKQHHEWTSPMGLVSNYAHPIEHLVSNISPTMLGSLLVGPHLFTLWLWILVAKVCTVRNHSGYHLPFFNSPEFHDFHHLKFNTCYGAAGFLDRFHGTDALFLKSKASKRHKAFFSRTPISKQIPD